MKKRSDAEAKRARRDERKRDAAADDECGSAIISPDPNNHADDQPARGTEQERGDQLATGTQLASQRHVT